MLGEEKLCDFMTLPLSRCSFHYYSTRLGEKCTGDGTMYRPIKTNDESDER